MGVRDKMLFDRGCSQFKAMRTYGSIEELFQGGTRFYKLRRSEQVSVPNKEIQSVNFLIDCLLTNRWKSNKSLVLRLSHDVVTYDGKVT